MYCRVLRSVWSGVRAGPVVARAVARHSSGGRAVPFTAEHYNVQRGEFAEVGVACCCWGVII